jgi:hypothetical protein
MIKTTPPSIFMSLLSVALASCVTMAGCGRATPPGPSSSSGVVEPNTHFHFLSWKDGLAVMFVDNIADAHHSGGHGSISDPVHRSTGGAESKEGDRYDWEIESIDGRIAKLTINGIDYEIDKGSVFVIRMKDKRPTVEQLDLDLSQLTHGADCAAFIKENRKVLKLPNMNDAPE